MKVSIKFPKLSMPLWVDDPVVAPLAVMACIYAAFLLGIACAVETGVPR